MGSERNSSKKRTPAKTEASSPTDTPTAAAQVGIHYSCDSCFKDISQVLRIQCAECEEVDLCAECFANGVEFQTHQRHHSYRILPPLSFPITPHHQADEGEWRADEEMLLLEGCENHGLGNWEDVAEHVGARDMWQCEAHFYAVYLPGHQPPLPKPPSRQAWDEAATPAPSMPATHEIAGFMPLRGEFETEYDNDFEAQLKDFLFTDDDSAVEQRLKQALLECYSAVLDARHARRRFIREHGLVEFKRQQAVEKARTKEDREVFHALRPFARFLSPADFDALHKGLVREEVLKRRIGQLQEYRRHGLRSLAQVPAYENERKHFELYLKGGLISQGTPPLSKPAAPTSHTPVANDPSSSGAAAQSSSSARKASNPLNISHADGVELLSEREREICSILRLLPRLYLHIKDTLIREYIKHGGLKRAQARAAIKIDVNKTSKLYDFFSSAGWIKPPASGE